MVSVKITKNSICFVNIVGKNTSTFVLKEETDYEPSFRSDVNYEGKVEDMSVEVVEDLVNIKAMYRNTQGPFRKLEPQEIYVQIPMVGARNHMEAIIVTDIRYEPFFIEVREGKEKARQYKTLNFEVTLYEDIKVNFVSDIKCNQISCQKELITMELPLAKGRGNFEKEIDIPSQYQDKEIIDYENELYFEDYIIKKDEIELLGRNVTRIYFEKETDIEEYICEQNFNYPLPLGGVPQKAKLNLRGDVNLDTSTHFRSGGLRQTFTFTADAYSNNSFYGITHFSGSKEWDVMKKKVCVETVLAEGSNQTILNRDIQIKKNINKIVRSKAEGKVTDIKVIQNKVIVSGVVDKQIFFTEEDSNIVMEETVQDRFTHFVHLDGVYPGAHVRTNVRVEYVNHIIIGKQEIKGKTITDVRQSVVIEIKVIARKIKEIDLVTDVIPVSPIVYPPCHHPHHLHHKPPQGKIINYTVRSGDSLWKIARRYNTTIEAILSLNYIPNPDRIDIGQVIKVPVGY